jgi:transcriptional regulator with XRE-family HTH domain
MAIHTGQQMRLLRLSHGYTQKKIAEKLGMSHSNYAKMERGEIKISSDRLKQIAKLLQASSSLLLDGKKVMQSFKGFIKNVPATKVDVENLSLLVGELKKELQKLKKEVAGMKKGGRSY